jgi:LemA protein
MKPANKGIPMSGLVVALVIIVIIAFVLIAIYNGLVRSKNRVDEAWSDINVQLKRRYDLIPNLVNSVKGYAAHESKVFEDVSTAQLAGALKSLFAVSEAYPQLRASENFQQLQNELVDTEDKIQAARRFYNGNVRDFNTKLQVFPTNLFASLLGFKPREFFGTEDQAAIEQPVNVQF